MINTRNPLTGVGLYPAIRWQRCWSMAGRCMACGGSGILAEKGHGIAALTQRALRPQDAATGTLVGKDHNEDIP